MAVRVVEGQRNLACNAQRFIDRELTLAAQPVSERFTFDERHREPQRT